MKIQTEAPSKRFRSSIEDSDLNSIEDSDRSSIEVISKLHRQHHLHRREIQRISDFQKLRSEL
ncbi:hypothetical protein ACSBR2_038119 [Camellia fascicularis]